MFYRFSADEQLQPTFTQLFRIAFLDAWFVIIIIIIITMITMMTITMMTSWMPG